MFCGTEVSGQSAVYSVVVAVLRASWRNRHVLLFLWISNKATPQ